MDKDYIQEFREEYEQWSKKYSPLEFLEYGEEGDENYLKAQNTPWEFVWTNHGTCEDDMVTAGFHFFGDPPSCCWSTYGWFVSKVSSGHTSDESYESYYDSRYGECECYNEETEEGKEDCEDCYGEGHRTYYFD